MCAVAPTGPLLFRPVELGVLDRIGGLRAEELDERADHSGAALVGTDAVELPRCGALEEGEQHTGRAVGRRVVEHDLGRPAVARRLAGEPGITPERRVVHRVALDQGARGDPLGELIAPRRQRRVVRDAARQCGRNRDDHVRGGHVHLIRVHGRPAGSLLDPANGHTKSDTVAELLGEAERHELRAADEPVLLRAARCARERVDPAARVRVEERVQEREVGRLGGEDPLGEQPQHLSSRPRARVALYPGLERLRVELPGTIGRPRHFERHVPGETIEACLRLPDVGEHEGAEARTRAVTDRLVTQMQQMLPGVVRGERLEPELGGEFGHAELGRADPLPAELHDGAVGERVVEDPAADAVAGLEHHDLFARGHELARGDQSCDPGADDGHVGLDALRHLSSPAPAYVVSTHGAGSGGRRMSGGLDRGARRVRDGSPRLRHRARGVAGRHCRRRRHADRVDRRARARRARRRPGRTRGARAEAQLGVLGTASVRARDTDAG